MGGTIETKSDIFIDENHRAISSLQNEVAMVRKHRDSIKQMLEDTNEKLVEISEQNTLLKQAAVAYEATLASMNNPESEKNKLLVEIKFYKDTATHWFLVAQGE